jgi:thymidylate synthase (FAD)
LNRTDLLAKYAEPIPVLDYGFVQLLDVMGDDEGIEEAARVSYQAGTRKVSDTRGLLRYLLRHRHTTPFEMAAIKLRVKLPIFVERQFIRHRMASTNEMSARYSELPEEFYVPEPDQVCHQDKKNKQGRAEAFSFDAAQGFRRLCSVKGAEAFGDYRLVLHHGLARETARINLPLSTYTMKVWSTDAHNLLHFLALRLDAHAQYEIRVYAEAIARIVADWLPITWEAFEDYRLGSASFSRVERQALGGLLRLAADPVDINAAGIAAGLTGRELVEFVTKVERLRG